jgi:translation initiation factor IF-2
MPETKTIRLVNAAREFNVSTATIVEHLQEKGYDVQSRPTTKLSEEMYGVLLKEFHKDKGLKARADSISIGNKKREEVALDEAAAPLPSKKDEKEEIFVQSNLVDSGAKEEEDSPAPAAPAAPEKAPEKAPEPEPKAETPKAESEPEPESKDEASEGEAPKAGLSGPKVVGKVDLDAASGKKKAAPKKAAKSEEAPKKASESSKAKAPAAKATSESADAEDAPKVETPKADAAKPAAKADTPKAESTSKSPTPLASVDPEKPKAEDDNVIKTEKRTLDGPKVVGKIDLPVEKPRDADSRRGKRKRSCWPWPQAAHRIVRKGDSGEDQEHDGQAERWLQGQERPGQAPQSQARRPRGTRRSGRRCCRRQQAAGDRIHFGCRIGQPDGRVRHPGDFHLYGPGHHRLHQPASGR